MHIVYISIGSNQGDRKRNIRQALRSMLDFCIMDSVSKVYRTKPYGLIEQPDFINLAVKIFTELEPMELLKKLQGIENQLGRVHTIRWGQRTIDLDILFFDDLVIHSEKLIVPHPDLQNRFFVLKPLSDIDPDLIHPVLRKTVNEMLENLK